MAASARTAMGVPLAILAAGFWSCAIAGERGDWFESLKVPGTKASCCDISDCEATDADWRNGQWWAIVDDKWRPVPHTKVLTRTPSIDGAAYVCSGTPSWTIGAPSMEPPIYCFVPPSWPM